MSAGRGRFTDLAPVLALAGIAAAGSFTHIRDTANDHGQGGPMSWAIAVCIDLTCVMAARERQRDRRTGRRRVGWCSWPTLVLSGGILLSLAANLAQADPSGWGRVMAATPAACFLVAVSMLERRAAASVPEPAVPVAEYAVPEVHPPVPEPVPVALVPVPEPSPHQIAATKVFADDLAAGQVPSIRRIRTDLRIGQPKAREVRAYLSLLAEQ